MGSYYVKHELYMDVVRNEVQKIEQTQILR